MLTIDLELEQSLKKIAEQEHSSPNELIKKLINQYVLQRQPEDKYSSATDAPITKSLTGLLAKSNLNELDYKQHLADKYL